MQRIEPALPLSPMTASICRQDALAARDELDEQRSADAASVEAIRE